MWSGRFMTDFQVTRCLVLGKLLSNQVVEGFSRGRFTNDVYIPTANIIELHQVATIT